MRTSVTSVSPAETPADTGHLEGLLRPAVTLFAVLSLVTGLAYPLLTTGVAQAVFPEQSGGSLVRDAKGQVIGSSLIGQAFSDPRHFWGRPSATAPMPYNAAGSTGSNQGPSNPALQEAVKARIEALRAVDPGNTAPVPIDLVTASGSGLDPEMSRAAADYQVARVARLRGMPQAQVRALVDQHTRLPWLGFIGEPRVHVLELNLALDGVSSSR